MKRMEAGPGKGGRSGPGRTAAPVRKVRGTRERVGDGFSRWARTLPVAFQLRCLRARG